MNKEPKLQSKAEKLQSLLESFEQTGMNRELMEMTEMGVNLRRSSGELARVTDIMLKINSQGYKIETGGEYDFTGSLEELKNRLMIAKVQDPMELQSYQHQLQAYLKKGTPWLLQGLADKGVLFAKVRTVTAGEKGTEVQQHAVPVKALVKNEAIVEVNYVTKQGQEMHKNIRASNLKEVLVPAEDKAPEPQKEAELEKAQESVLNRLRGWLGLDK